MCGAARAFSVRPKVKFKRSRLKANYAVLEVKLKGKLRNLLHEYKKKNI
jgi:hypothetical protein